MLRSRSTLLLFALPLLFSCQAADASPDKAFRTFVARLQQGDVDGAWDLLSKGSQDELSAIVHQKSKESGGAIPDDPKRVILGDATLARPIDAIEVQSRSDDRATLLVRSGEESQPVQMVREGGRWKVDLR